MYDVKNLRIWKNEPAEAGIPGSAYDADIEELGLSVRSYNCLKRAGCVTVRDVLKLLGEDGQGLRKVRNLGASSEKEILAKLGEHERLYASEASVSAPADRRAVLLKVGGSTWNRDIREFGLSQEALQAFRACGIRRVSDLYLIRPEKDPGWYVVRELFEQVLIRGKESRT